MRMMMTMIGVATIVATPALAAETGRYEASLRKIVTEAIASRCPDDVMAEPLLSACRAQLSAMGPALAALGPVESVTFIKSDDRDGKRYESYAVRHAKGKTMIWGIGDEAGGKFGAAYTLDQ